MTDFHSIMNDVQPSPIDDRDHIVFVSAQTQFAHVDLLPDVEEVENQYQTGSCTANAAASALEIAYKRANQSKDFSRLYNYWYSRKIGNIIGDKGAYPRDVCKSLNKHGICLESTWEFDIVNNLGVEPSNDAQNEAKDYPVYEYARLDSGDIVQQIKNAVAAGIPVMTSIKVSAGFNTLGGDWKQHDWDPTVNFTGAHQVLIIGYNDDVQKFLAMNSWGNRWSDGGFFGIPYSRIGNNYADATTSAYEYWILTKLNVPYIAADGKESDPNNIVERETEREKKKKKTVETGFILGFILITIVMFLLLR